jgi:hypothetical protein
MTKRNAPEIDVELRAKLEDVKAEFLDGQKNFNERYCKRCFKCYKDENDKPLAETHECKPVDDKLIQEIKSILAENFPAPKRNTGYMMWILHEILNSIITSHLNRQAGRRQPKSKRVKFTGEQEVDGNT